MSIRVILTLMVQTIIEAAHDEEYEEERSAFIEKVEALGATASIEAELEE